MLDVRVYRDWEPYTKETAVALDDWETITPGHVINVHSIERDGGQTVTVELTYQGVVWLDYVGWQVRLVFSGYPVNRAPLPAIMYAKTMDIPVTVINIPGVDNFGAGPRAYNITLRVAA